MCTVLLKMLTGMAATAAVGAVLMVGTTQVASAQAVPAAQQAAQPGQPAVKQPVPKDTGEADIANAYFIDIQGNPPNWQKAVTDLNTWAQKYPDSDWKSERLMYYVQAYNGLGQKRQGAGRSAAQLLAMDVPAFLEDKSDVSEGLLLYRRRPSTDQERYAGAIRHGREGRQGVAGVHSDVFHGRE